MLFTYDQSFRTDWNMTPNRQVKRDKIDKLCADYGIQPKHIVYVGKEKYEKRSYVTEKHELIERFFRIWPHIRRQRELDEETQPVGFPWC